MAVNPLDERDLIELDTKLSELAQSYEEVRNRITQVKAAQLNREELLAKLQELEGQSELGGYKTQLRDLQQQLDQVELELESKLFNFTQLQRPFWWIVRFGGGGILLGWWLNVLAGG
jgi:hypothetical protein